MKDKDFDMTPRQLERLMSDLPDFSQESAVAHLTDEEMIGYAMELLSHDDVLRLDAHLASCIQCASAMEHLLEVESAWQGEAGAQRLTSLSGQILKETAAYLPKGEGTEVSAWLAAFMEAMKQFQGKWRSLFEQPNQIKPLFAADERKEKHKVILTDVFEKDNVYVRFRAVVDPDGNVIFYFTSKSVEKAGVRLLVSLGEFSQEIVLRRVSKTEIANKIVIARQDRPNDMKSLRLEMIL